VTLSRAVMLEAIKKELAIVNPSSVLGQQLKVERRQLPAITMDVWFDQTGLIRRSSVAESGVAPGASSSVLLNMSMTYTNYGVPVDITAPAPGESVNLNDVPASNQPPI
jgi:hypothetical protein